jgi:nitrile hydratase beta subunit
MNGIHDMGGMHGFGSVEPEADEPVFHAEWERRAFAISRAMGAAGLWNIDETRFSRESIAPDVYLASSYYKKWLLGLEALLLQHKLVGADELTQGHSLRPGATLPRKLLAAEVERALWRRPYERPAPAPAQFKIGERVCAKNINPPTHTRLPRYVRGHAGVVERIHGCHVFPDAASTGAGERPQWLYTVVFQGVELWGTDADPMLKVSIEAFEPYLESA